MQARTRTGTTPHAKTVHGLSDQTVLGTDVAFNAGASRRCLNTVGLGRLAVPRERLHATFLGEEATWLPMGERHLRLPRARREARFTTGGIELATDTFARQVVLEAPNCTGVLLGDNHLDMAPGARQVVSVPAEASEVRVRAYNADELRVREHTGRRPSTDCRPPMATI